MTDELSQTCWECRRDPCKCEQAALASKDQQGASLESDDPVERLHIEWQVLDLRDGYAVSVFHDRVMALLRQQHAALASKASPDDQRQEGVALPPRRQASDYIADTYGPADLAAIWNACRSETSRLNSASPPTEAAAAVGGLLALALEIESRSFRDTTDDDLVRWSRQIKEAALSPTASAAREGSDG